MLLTAALALIGLWLMGGLVGRFAAGDLWHVLLLVGLLFLLLAILRARDEALRRTPTAPRDPR
jgi:hypothetical protein